MTDVFDLLVNMPIWIAETANNIVDIFMDSFYENGLRIVNIIAEIIGGADGNLPILDGLSNLYTWGYEGAWDILEYIIPNARVNLSLFDLMLTIGLPFVIGLTIIKWIIGIFT